jgi:hypothetical protein
VEGTFDCDDVLVGIAVGMQYSAALCQWLLLQVEQLEERVCGQVVLLPFLVLTSLPAFSGTVHCGGPRVSSQ